MSIKNGIQEVKCDHCREWKDAREMTILMGELLCTGCAEVVHLDLTEATMYQGTITEVPIRHRSRARRTEEEGREEQAA